MGKQEKYKDDRDVFEKALDEAKPWLGAAVGGAVGSRIGGRLGRGMSKKALAQLEEDARAAYQREHKTNRATDARAADRLEAKAARSWENAAVGKGVGAIGGAVEGAYAGYLSKPETRAMFARNRHRK